MKIDAGYPSLISYNDTTIGKNVVAAPISKVPSQDPVDVSANSDIDRAIKLITDQLNKHENSQDQTEHKIPYSYDVSTDMSAPVRLSNMGDAKQLSLVISKMILKYRQNAIQAQGSVNPLSVLSLIG